jgi:hypothetical protein
MRGVGKPNLPPEQIAETTTDMPRPSVHVDRLFPPTYFQSESGTSLPTPEVLGFQGLPLIIHAEKWTRFAVSR